MDYKNLKYMENQNAGKSDCGCGTDCCQPKKGKVWPKIIFIVIILAVVAIITLKLVGKNESKPLSGCDSTSIHKSGCCDTSGLKTVSISDTTKNKSCCPKAKK